MEALEKYVERAENCSNRAADQDSGEAEETFWQREAQIQATLALVAAVLEVRTVLIDRLPE